MFIHKKVFFFVTFTWKQKSIFENSESFGAVGVLKVPVSGVEAVEQMKLVLPSFVWCRF